MATVADIQQQIADGARPLALPTRRLRTCVENWPEAETGGYDPRCCRFPKSCSATVYDEGAVTDGDLEPVEISQHCNGCGNWMPPPAVHKATCPTRTRPLVLTLPVVPAGAVALIGNASGRRWLPYSWPESDERMWQYRASDAPWSLTSILHDEPEGVTVEFAPPREPRTWPKLDPAPEIDNLPRTVDVEGHGRWSRLATHHFYPEADPNGAPLTLAGLRELGEVREVLT